jgi:hypothetical protein
MPQDLDWEECQRRSDELLVHGVGFLRNQRPVAFGQMSSTRPGNYLISLDAEPLYVGEAANLRLRLRQQFIPKTSTFHKSYLARHGQLPIERFHAQCIETAIGRKEVEESGIVNIPCRLNKFQLGKRAVCSYPANPEMWLRTQCCHTALLEEGARAVMSSPLTRGSHATPPRAPGIYLIRMDATAAPLYVGESSDLAERWCEAHGRSTYFSALRRHIATELLGFTLKVRNGKAKYLDDAEDRHVSQFLEQCWCAFTPVRYGRFELEEYLIRAHRPKLNRKSNKFAVNGVSE